MAGIHTPCVQVQQVRFSGNSEIPSQTTRGRVVIVVIKPGYDEWRCVIVESRSAAATGGQSQAFLQLNGGVIH